MLALKEKEIDSNPQRRQENLEILLCQKAEQGDVSSLIEVLNYLRSTQNEQQWQKVAKTKNQEQMVFDSLQRILITAFAVLGMICFFDRVFNPTESMLNRSSNQIEQLEKQN